MTTFLDAELSALATEVTTHCGRTQYPFAISLERTPSGTYVWTAWLENRGVAVEASAQEPSIAIAEALESFHRTTPERCL